MNPMELGFLRFTQDRYMGGGDIDHRSPQTAVMKIQQAATAVAKKSSSKFNQI
jgi:hypothetical protein